MKLLYSITKDKIVTNATWLIKVLEQLKEEIIKEASKKGFHPNKQRFEPTCSWDKINNSDEEINLKLKIDIYDYKD